MRAQWIWFAGFAAMWLAPAAAQAPTASYSTPHLQVDPFWPKPLPNDWVLGQVSGVAVDSRGHVWIVQRPPSRQFGNPVHCVRPTNDGLVYVCDRVNAAVDFIDGVIIYTFGEKGLMASADISGTRFWVDEDLN
jgi:hypothetical protein